MKTSAMKKNLRHKRKAKPVFSKEDFVSTGSTQLNLACSGTTYGGFPKGIIVLMVGDKSTRKTWIGMTCLAEAAMNEAFDDYDLIFDNAENGSLMNKERYFGKKATKRIKIVRSGTIEELFDSIDTDLDKGSGTPFIRVVDSLDVLPSKTELAQVDKDRRARASNRDESGSYNTSRPKIASARLRSVNHYLPKNGSILVLISQTRQNIGWAARFEPKTRSGGDAFGFYNRIEFWMSQKEKLKRKVRGKDRIIGNVIRAKFKKNHVSGWEGGSVDVTFFRSTGLDDVGSCIDFLVEEKHWVGKEKIHAKEFDRTMDREALVRYIEATDNEPRLKKIVRKVWKDIEEQSSVTRKRKYE